MIYSESGLDSNPVEIPGSSAMGSSELSTRLERDGRKCKVVTVVVSHVDGFCCLNW